MLLAIAPLLFLAAAPSPAKLAITDVTVIDVAAGKPQPGMTVLVVGDRITGVGKADTVAVPADAVVVAGDGKFLTPGLWDMHAHVESEAFLPLFLGNGVTGVRHMFTGSPLAPPVRQWQKEVGAGKRAGPRIVAATRVLDGLNGDRPTIPGSAVAVTSPKEAREAVAKLRADGEDFIKVYPFLDRASYFAVLDEAARGPRKLPVVGHVPHAVTAAEASDRGQKSLEHGYGILLDCSKDAEKLRKDLVALATSGAMAKDTLDAAAAWRFQVKALDTYDADRADALFRKLVKNGTRVTPTLVTRRVWTELADPAFTSDPRKKFLPLFISATWTPSVAPDGTVTLPLFAGLKLTKDDVAAQKLLFEGHLKLVGAMNKAGVKLLAGTDTPVPYCFPGSGLHDELELLVKAGLTPAEALRAATRNPAEFLGRLDDLGTVEPGKLADLVLLDADPLADVRNARKVHAVVIGGKLFPKSVVGKMAEGRKP